MNTILIFLLNISLNTLFLTTDASGGQPHADIVTRIAPVQQDYGVGDLNTVMTNPPQCDLQSEPLEARVSNLIGGQYFAWIIWDMTAIPQDAEITGIEIEYTLYPNPANVPGTRIQYRSLESTYLDPPECWTAYDELLTGLLYLDVEMGTTPGVRLDDLGGDAVSDAAGAVAARGYFSLWIISSGMPGSATFHGWSAGGPELVVSWRSDVAVKSSSWGAIKALLR